jgi:hypothetical protein
MIPAGARNWALSISGTINATSSLMAFLTYGRVMIMDFNPWK